MDAHQIPDVAPHWTAIESFLKSRFNQPIDIHIASGGILKYQVLGQLGKLSFEFPGQEVPAILTRWKAVHIRQLPESILITASGATNEEGLKGVHEIFETALRMNMDNPVPFANSLTFALQQYRKLVAGEDLNQQVLLGLLGELIVLDMIRSQIGFDKAISAWHAKEDSLHDFDMGSWDLEVKTTRRASRIHRISSLAQLDPSENRRLFLMSIHLIEAGQPDEDTFSLKTFVNKISNLLSPYDRELQTQFIDRVNLVLDKVSFDADELTRNEIPYYRFRSPIRIVEVDSHFPRITKSTISCDESLKNRITSVEYDIDCEDLGSENFNLFGGPNDI